MKAITFKTLPEYFEFFEKIPRHKWTTGDLKDKCGCRCAMGHLNYFDIKNAYVKIKNTPLGKMAKAIKSEVWKINDGYEAILNCKELGQHPQDRILNAIILHESGILKALNKGASNE